ncbi:MAG: head-tail connector protein [Oscillospiraceae bacterium]
MSAGRREELLAYCRIDVLEPGEETLLGTLYDAAVRYLASAGIRQPTVDSDWLGQYNLCVDALVLDTYERRGADVFGTPVVDNPAFRRMLNQLKRIAPVSNLDTGAGGGGI